jgi:hypothetical protein
MIARLPPGTFFGETRRRVSCDGLTFTETVYPGAMVIPAHEHPGGYLSLTVEGSHIQLIGGRAQDAPGVPSWTVLYHSAWSLGFGTSLLVYSGLTLRRPGGAAWPRGS